MKNQILDAIGVTELRPAAGLNAALAANDRVKFYFSLLQMAVSHADHPEQPAAGLKRERQICGIDDASLDDLVANARREADRYVVPGAGRVLASIAADMHVMAAPVLASGKAGYQERLTGLLHALPAAPRDRLAASDITDITRAGRDSGKAASKDSLHALVMDLHKELNALQAAMAEEQMDGAAVYGLAATDRPYITAFMAGVNRTAKLKFDHPGLGTTATSSGGQLVIQNDIGTTDAHVIVIHVTTQNGPPVVTVTYSDVHPERVRFFQAMLASAKVTWDGERTAHIATLAEGLPFELITGHFQAEDAAGAETYLTLLGSRLVFLIDWNRARKQLRGFLRGPERLAVLVWAAAQECGHRGFLELGGAQVVNQAIEAAAGTAMHFGDRLCDVLGTEPTVAFLKFVMEAAAHGLLEGQSHGLIRDRIRAELQRHFSNDEFRLLGVAADHAGLIFEIASLVRDGVLAAGAGEHGFDKRAKRAIRYEHEADLLVVTAREAARRRPDQAVFKTLLETADDAADHLEDVAFLLELLADTTDRAKHHGKSDAHPKSGERRGGDTLEALLTLSEITLEAVQEWIKALGHAAHVRTPGQREDTDDFLTSIDRVAVLEHQADAAQREVTRLAVRHSTDFRQLHLYAAIGDTLEQGMDAIKHASLVLRGHVLGEVLGG